MIENMNQEEFLVDLNQRVCHSDWHRRYYMRRAEKFHRIDYWLRSLLGLLALLGAAMAGMPEWRLIGAWVAGGCAFLLANLLPIFKWDEIVSGFKSEEEEWTRIFKGYEDIVSFTKISDRGEILVQEFQRVKEMQKAAALNARRLPKSQKCLDDCDAEVRKYYGLEEDSEMEKPAQLTRASG